MAIKTVFIFFYAFTSFTVCTRELASHEKKINGCFFKNRYIGNKGYSMLLLTTTAIL